MGIACQRISGHICAKISIGRCKDLSAGQHIKEMAGFISHEAFKVSHKQCIISMTGIHGIFSERGISVSAMDEKRMGSMNKNPKILHVTAASSYKSHSSNDSMKFLTQNFCNRKKSDKDIWLFGLDTSVQDMKAIKNMYESS